MTTDELLQRLDRRIAAYRHFEGCEDYHVLCAARDAIRQLRRQRDEAVETLHRLTSELEGRGLIRSCHGPRVEIGERRPA